ncbi:MAG: hypothetical protein K2H61_08690 [Muribaculaceae bacterium]|nr:hypothetical protein [Muribaculaceae bacterium]
MRSRILMMIAILSTILISCSQYDDQQELFAQDETSEILAKAESFNDSLLSIKGTTSRGFLSKFARFCAIAGADVAGAYECGKIGGAVGTVGGPTGTVAGAAIGGLIGGVGASYTAHRSTRNEDFIPIERVVCGYTAVKLEEDVLIDTYPQKIKLKLPEEAISLQEIGLKHNLILKKLQETSDLSPDINQILTPIEKEVLSSSAFVEQYNLTLNKSSNFLEYSKAQSNDVDDRLMSMYLNLFLNFPDKLDDVEFISNKYIEMIQNDDSFSELEKGILYQAICVAAYSIEFWSEE